MFKEFLKKITKVITINFDYDVKKIGNIHLNKSIFTRWIPKDIDYHKKRFIKKLNIQKVKLRILKLEIVESKLNLNEKKILFNEISYRIAQINFLIKTYDIEANKIFPDHIVKKLNINYSKYNKTFFWLTKDTLNKRIIENFSGIIKYDLYFSKEKLIELIDFSKSILPIEIEFIFWKFHNLSHNSWKLKIPDNLKYWIKFIITLFFHEMTHYFRYYNQIANFGLNFSFSDYTNFEEWMALYNEYLYGNKILKIWNYIPYYDMCYMTLLQEIPEEQKKQEIYNILKYKWYSKKKAISYYNRFYKFALLWSKDLFLKDLIYNNWYKNVVNLIKKDPSNYNKIMAWKIWLKELKSWIIWCENNFLEKKYFEKMVEKIKSMIL